MPPIDLQITVEKIFPKNAKEMLESNTHNRNVSERLVAIYAEAMTAGEWCLNGEPLIFDRTGTLQSGQHRLLACIESGCPFWTVVVRGAEPASLYSLDTGRKRKLTDALTLLGEKDVANLATAVTWYWRWVEGAMDRSGVTATTTTLLRVLDENSALRESVAAARPVKAAIGPSCGLYGCLHYGLSLISPSECTAFFEALASGADLPSDSPVFSLRRWIIRSRRGERRTPSNVYAAVTIKAWNAYRQHQSLSAVRWAGNEPFPVAI